MLCMYDGKLYMHDGILSWQIMSASHHNVTWTPTSSDLSKTYPLNRTLQWACVKAGLPDHLDQQKCRPNKEWALLVFSGGTGTKVCQAGFWTNTFMGTPTTRSLRAKTGSFSNNYRGWNKFQTVFSLLLKPHQIQQRFGPNRTFFRLHYINLYNNGKCTTTQLYSLNNKFGNAVMLVVMAGNAGCRGLSHRCWFQTAPGWLAQVSSSFLCLSCVLCHPWEFSLLPSPPGPRENGLVGWSGK